MAKTVNEIIELPSGVNARIEGSALIVQGPKGSARREILAGKIFVSVEGNKISVSSPISTQREKMLIGSLRAHVNNLIKGVSQGHVYRMKICSGHFPMSVSINGREFVIKNFFGEKTPRKCMIPEGVILKIKGADIEIELYLGIYLEV
jgi:large subunit ribosomal protein L6